MGLQSAEGESMLGLLFDADPPPSLTSSTNVHLEKEPALLNGGQFTAMDQMVKVFLEHITIELLMPSPKLSCFYISPG